MRINNVQVTPIALGDPPLLNASGLHAPYALRAVVELTTNTGLTGISEVPGDSGVVEALGTTAEHVVGRDPRDMDTLMAKVRSVLTQSVQNKERGEQSWDKRHELHAESALEVACLDLIGKHTGKRVAELLGSVKRERVPYAGYLFFKYEGAGGPLGFATDPQATGWPAARQKQALSPEEIIDQARAMIDAFGFQSLKLKAGILEPAVEVSSIHALREAFGSNIPLRIDPNAVWSYQTAFKYGKEMKGVIEYYEDPVRGQEAMARLRKKLNIPLATNMCTTSFDDLPKSFALGSEDIILADHHFWGGIRNVMRLTEEIEGHNRALSLHSNSHAGITLAAMTHVGAVLKDLHYTLDTHYPWQEDEIIVGGKLEIQDGFVTLPSGPGLGVNLDRDALARAHKQYLNAGITERNDEKEMQKKQPGWTLERTRY